MIREEITAIQVYNNNDPDHQARVMGVSFNTQWWAQATDAAKDIIWRGLESLARERWAAEDAAKEHVAEHAADQPVTDDAESMGGEYSHAFAPQADDTMTLPAVH